MLKLFGYSFVLSTALVASFAYFALTGIEQGFDPRTVYTGTVEDHRHFAECEAHGCPHVEPSPLFACAWREIIVEETDRNTPVDVTAAANACSSLTGQQRELLPRVEADIRARLHLKGTRRS